MNNPYNSKPLTLIYYNVNPYNPFIFLTIITPNPYKNYETKPYITSNLTNIPSNL